MFLTSRTTFWKSRILDSKLKDILNQKNWSFYQTHPYHYSPKSPKPSIKKNTHKLKKQEDKMTNYLLKNELEALSILYSDQVQIDTLDNCLRVLFTFMQEFKYLGRTDTIGRNRFEKCRDLI